VKLSDNETDNSDPVGGADFAAVLREAIAARAVSLVWLRDRLVDLGSPVSLTTLGYRRSGRRHPERHGLGPGVLTARWGFEAS
jgi:hypothetical protein